MAAVPLDVARQGDALAREELLGRLGSHQVLRMSVGIPNEGQSSGWGWGLGWDWDEG